MLVTADTSALTGPVEFSFWQKLIDYPEMVEAAAKEFSPHLIAFYLKELAGEFHSYYNSTRFLVPEIRSALRDWACGCDRQVLSNGLETVGRECAG